MPFINGRYHVNPLMGQALEAAREAEAALLALQQRASRNSGDAPGDSSANSLGDEAGEIEDSSGAASSAGQGPIHRVEIEVTQLTPQHSGRAARGFVARVHRAPGASAASPAPAPETQVFAHHRDLANFLRDSLSPSP
jgi:hypothetical protein